MQYSTQSVCPICEKSIDAEYKVRDGKVYFEKVCDIHGEFKTLAAEDATEFDFWLKKEPINIPPKGAITKGKEGECPLHCGTCDLHLQTACCVLIDVTERCNQKCPYCFASSGENMAEDPSLDKIESMYDRLIELGEERPFNIQLSGGEPTVRDDLPEIVRMGKEKGFEYIQLNTNGRRLADIEYAQELKDAGVSTVFLQFDGTDDKIYKALRNEELLDVKKKVIVACEQVGLPVTLVPTMVEGVNIDNIGSMIDFMFEHLNVIKGIHFQPVSLFGRYPDDNTEGYEQRVTMFKVMSEIEKQSGGKIATKDLIPINTGHPLCCFTATYLREEDGNINLLRGEEDTTACCCEPDPLEVIKKDRDYVLNMWQTSEEGDIFSYLKDNIFTITGMAFQDIMNLDAERVKRCRVQMFTQDEKLIPFCGYNSIYREKGIK